MAAPWPQIAEKNDKGGDVMFKEDYRNEMDSLAVDEAFRRQTIQLMKEKAAKSENTAKPARNTVYFRKKKSGICRCDDDFFCTGIFYTGLFYRCRFLCYGHCLAAAKSGSCNSESGNTRQ